MRHPQLIVAGDETLTNPLQAYVEEHKWRLIHVADAEKVRPVVGCPTLLLLQVDVDDAKLKMLNAMIEVHQQHPDVAIVVVLSAKVGSDERAAWLASLLDLGARYVLVPPHPRSVLEDLLGGLMAATIARVTGTALVEPVVDLADEEPID